MAEITMGIDQPGRAKQHNHAAYDLRLEEQESGSQKEEVPVDGLPGRKEAREPRRGRLRNFLAGGASIHSL
jgi:hypothetical protein